VALLGSGRVEESMELVDEALELADFEQASHLIIGQKCLSKLASLGRPVLTPNVLWLFWLTAVPNGILKERKPLSCSKTMYLSAMQNTYFDANKRQSHFLTLPFSMNISGLSRFEYTTKRSAKT
jgi:hypothetical protein